jgi:hypothetical protein
VHTLLQRFESVARQRWFGDAALLAICVVVVGLALLMTPSSAEISLFGWDVPILCTFRRLTGWPCPGCGLTRSFVFLAHGQLADAFRMNVFGPFAFVWVLAQIPWRALRIRRSVLHARATPAAG